MKLSPNTGLLDKTTRRWQSRSLDEICLLRAETETYKPVTFNTARGFFTLLGVGGIAAVASLAVEKLHELYQRFNHFRNKI